MGNTGKIKTRKLSIQWKLFLGALFCGVLVCVLLGGIIYSIVSQMMIDSIKQNSLSIAKIAAGKIDGGIHDSLKSGDEESENYKKLVEDLQDYIDSTKIEFIYTLKPLDDKNVQFVLDADESEDKAMIGESYESYKEIDMAMSGEATVDSEVTTDEWGNHYSAYAPIYSSDGKIIGVLGIDFPIDEVNRQLQQLLNIIMIVGFFCVLITVLGAILVSKSIGRNLRKVDEKLNEVVHSDGDLTKSIEIHSGDELEVFADALNEFLGQTRGIITEITQVTNKINETSDVISENMDSVTVKTTSVADTIKGMSAFMGETREAVKKMYTFTEISYQGFEEINGRISEGSELTDDIEIRASQLKEQGMNAQISTRQKIKDINFSLNDKIEQSKAVQQINELTENIIEIANQTNLLALNANIEAARAGEGGRGFAVVAGQIGLLAEDSNKTATKIQRISSVVIKAVEELAMVATDMIDYINATVMEDYDKLVFTGQQYSEDAETIQNLIQGFKGEVGNLHDAMHQIRKSLRTVAEDVDESADEIKGVSVNIDSINENVHDIQNRMMESCDSAINLGKAVGHFKI